jgi:hypothetical protein
MSLGVSEGGCIDFYLVNGTWQLAARQTVAADYFGPAMNAKLLERQQRIDAGSYIKIRDIENSRVAVAR